MATLTYRHKVSDTPLAGSAKDLRSVSTSSFRRTTSVDMVQLMPSKTSKTLVDASKLVSPDPGNPPPSNDRQLTSIQPDVVLRLSQETHKTKVFEIDLSGNAIKKIENLDGFSHLRILDLACNQVEQINNLTRNTELRELRLYANRISRIENLEQLKKLSVLKLQQNNIEQIGEGLAQQRVLEVLRIDSNCLRNMKPSELLPLQSLRVLNISRNHLTDISSILCLPKLETLDASHNNIPVLPNLKKCPFLQDVNVSSNRLDNLASLADNLQLTTLDVANNALKSLRSLGQRKQNLETVNVAGNIIESLDELPAIAPNVEILDFSKNRLNNIEKLLTMLQQLESLVELKCFENPVFDAITPHEIRQVLPTLEMINGVSFAKRTFIPAVDPALVRPQTPAVSATGERGDESGPLMSAAVLRPKTANTGLTIRQIDSIFSNLSGAMENLERSFARTFEEVVSTLETEAPTCEHSESPCKSCRANRIKQENQVDDLQKNEEQQDTEVADTSPVPSSSGSSSMSGGKTPQAKNALRRRLEQARNFSMKMAAQSGGTKPTKPAQPVGNNTKISTVTNNNKTPQSRPQPRQNSVIQSCRK